MAHLLVAKPGDSVLRIVREDRRMRLRLGTVRPGDQTFAHDGRVVLALDEGIGTRLTGSRLDVRETDEGPRLRLKR
jgi:hypothetical protein